MVPAGRGHHDSRRNCAPRRNIELLRSRPRSWKLLTAAETGDGGIRYEREENQGGWFVPVRDEVMAVSVIEQCGRG